MSGDRISRHNDSSSKTMLTDDQVEELTDFSLEAKALRCHFELYKGLGVGEEKGICSSPFRKMSRGWRVVRGKKGTRTAQGRV